MFFAVMRTGFAVPGAILFLATIFGIKIAPFKAYPFFFGHIFTHEFTLLMVVLKKTKGNSKKVDHSIFNCNMVV